MAARQPWVGFHFRAKAAWVDWLRRLARYVGVPVSELVGRALASFAASVGFEPPPPRN